MAHSSNSEREDPEAVARRLGIPVRMVPSSSDLPVRLQPITLSTEAANKLHSVTFDAVRLGMSTALEQHAGADYTALTQSRKALVQYISQLEEALHIPQQTFYRFD